MAFFGRYRERKVKSWDLQVEMAYVLNETIRSRRVMAIQPTCISMFGKINIMSFENGGLVIFFW